MLFSQNCGSAIIAATSVRLPTIVFELLVIAFTILRL